MKGLNRDETIDVSKAVLYDYTSNENETPLEIILPEHFTSHEGFELTTRKYKIVQALKPE